MAESPRIAPAALLSVQTISRVVNGRALVDDLSFEMAEGEILAILGPSGSGKTSLLRLLAGFDAPSAGRLRLHGALVSEPGRVVVPPEARGLGLAFQDATLFPHLDALANAAFAVQAASPSARRQLARDALADMGLTGMDGRDVATLSGGEAQRVALARALAGQPRLLLLDEPFGNVDRLTRADLLLRLKPRLAAASGAVIITHDPADAVELGARVLLMREGRLVADGTPAALADGRHGDWPRRFLQIGR